MKLLSNPVVIAAIGGIFLAAGLALVLYVNSDSTGDHEVDPSSARQASTATPPPPTAASEATATASPTTPVQTPEADAPRRDAPALYLSQVTGAEGCKHPLYLRGVSLPPKLAVSVERVDPPAALERLNTSENGWFSIETDEAFPSTCAPGQEYEFRLVRTDTGEETARAVIPIHDLRGTIEVDPPAGGCEEITITVNGMPPNTRVVIMAHAPLPFQGNAAPAIWPPLMTDAQGYARSEPTRPSWLCTTSAISLSATAVEDNDIGPIATLLYPVHRASTSTPEGRAP